jgi:hypothetical protein
MCGFLKLTECGLRGIARRIGEFYARQIISSTQPPRIQVVAIEIATGRCTNTFAARKRKAFFKSQDANIHGHLEAVLLGNCRKQRTLAAADRRVTLRY